MDVSKFSERAREALETAQGVVRRGPGNMLGTEHLLIGVLSLPGGVVEQILNLLGIDKGAAMTRANQFAQNQPVGSGPPGAAPADMLYMTPRAKAAIDIAVQQSQKMGDEFVGTEHLLLGIFLEGEGPGSAILKDLGMTEESLLRALAEVRDTGVDYEGNATGESMLKKYTRDLTALARDGRLDPVIGRDAEIKRVIQVLSRRTKNNPALIGEPGRGQDGHRRGSRPEDRGRRRARDPARPARAGARPRRHGRRRQVPRRVRGAPQGRARRGAARQGRRAVHRRAAQRRRAPARPRARSTPRT